MDDAVRSWICALAVAATWLERVERGLAPGEVGAFLAWIVADPIHADAYNALLPGDPDGAFDPDTIILGAALARGRRTPAGDAGRGRRSRDRAASAHRREGKIKGRGT